MWEEETIEGPSYRLKNDVIIELKETEYEGQDWLYLAQCRVYYHALMDTEMSLQAAQKAVIFLTN
jgi:hypothetical protein